MADAPVVAEGAAPQAAKLASSLIVGWAITFVINIAIRGAGLPPGLTGLMALAFLGYAIYVCVQLNKLVGLPIWYAIGMIVPCLNLVFVIMAQTAVVKAIGPDKYKVGLLGVTAK